MPQWVATAGDDSKIKIWSLDSFKCLHTLQGHSSYIRKIIVLQDQSLIASASYDQTIKIWEYSKQMCEKTLQAHTKPVMALDKLLDDLIVSGAEDFLIKIWNFREGSCVKQLRFQKDEVWSVLTN